MSGYLDVSLFMLVGIAFPFIGLAVAWLLRPARMYDEKQSVYECGELPFGDARIKFHAHYYIFALLFVVFDVETVFLYPWAVVFKELGLFGFIEMMIFIGILVVGLVYAWRKKVLKWI